VEYFRCKLKLSQWEYHQHYPTSTLTTFPELTPHRFLHSPSGTIFFNCSYDSTDI